MANNLDFTLETGSTHRHFDNVTRTKPSDSPTHPRGAERDDLPPNSGTFMTVTPKRKHVEDKPFSFRVDASSHNEDREARDGMPEIERRMSYLDLCEQVKVLTGLAFDNQNSNSSLAKRFKRERDFGSAGNKAQHTVNSDVIDLVEQCFHALNTGHLTRLEDCLNEIRRLMVERNKLVLIADTSEFGWAAAKAYSNSAVFLNDEEDKKLKKVEVVLRSAKKTKTENVPKPKGRGVSGAGRGRGNKPTASNENVPVVAPQYNLQNQMPPMFSYSMPQDPYTSFYNMPPFPAMAGHFPGQVYQSVTGNKSNIKCYGCQQFGHVKTDCPNRHMWSNPTQAAITK
jgi:hypothetical protein